MTKKKLHASRRSPKPERRRRFNGWHWETELPGATHLGLCRNRQGIAIYVTTKDPHGVCRHCGRPFESVTERRAA